MQQAIIEKAGALLQETAASGADKGQFCTLALLDQDGYPTVSALTISKAEGIRWITFCTGLTSNKARRIARSNRASVCFAEGEHYTNITLVGTMEIVTDPQVKQDMWYSGLEYHFTGPEDPNYCVLRFTTQRYNLFVDGQEAAGTL